MNPPLGKEEYLCITKENILNGLPHSSQVNPISLYIKKYCWMHISNFVMGVDDSGVKFFGIENGEFILFDYELSTRGKKWFKDFNKGKKVKPQIFRIKLVP